MTKHTVLIELQEPIKKLQRYFKELALQDIQECKNSKQNKDFQLNYNHVLFFDILLESMFLKDKLDNPFVISSAIRTLELDGMPSKQAESLTNELANEVFYIFKNNLTEKDFSILYTKSLEICNNHDILIIFHELC